MGKRKQRRINKFRNKKDRISELPDSIICSILLLLTMKDAVKTSILSRRWRFLWASSLSNLNFDLYTMLGGRQPERRYDKKDKELLQHETGRFVRRVEKLFMVYQGVEVKSFRVSFFLGRRSDNDINRWISSAVKMRVEKIDLNLSYKPYFFGYPGLPVDEQYIFPDWLLSQGRSSGLKHLRLEACILRPVPDFSGFNSLITLALEDVNVAEGCVECLLSNCLLLEGLSMTKCMLSTKLSVIGASLHLKYLNILCCHDLEKIEISASNLISFNYIGDILRVAFGSATKLIKVHIGIPCNIWGGINYALTGLANDLPLLETLSLCSWDIEGKIIPASISTFNNLKQLNLAFSPSRHVDLLWIASILKASPFLQKLRLLMGLSKLNQVRSVIRRPSKCPHNQLKEIEFSGFLGNQNEIELAIYLLDNAIALERMVIDPLRKFYRGGDKWNVIGAHVEWAKTRQERVREWLCKEVPPNVQLEIR
ncbi:hypothetical protein HHK36_019958 [Tetracentron sinense]|uniref:F-box domain-containing protein n=1 Tax=Tetracentron sinense TaxID=13715 RepID=A0A834YU73_TETSI|nr:hypothetical protein HHK36_019958 [Tetracentron sinense]